jgi:DNA-binding NarL/FixJ family response regulator
MAQVDTTPIRILVVDDHPVVRDGLVLILSTQADFSVVGQAESGRKALELAPTLNPDVVLLDLEMPEMDGVQVLQELRILYPQVRVLVFTAFDTDERILGAIQAGAQGYMLKGAARDELFRAIRTIHAGGSLIQPLVEAKGDEQSGLPEKLTLRELEVLQRMAQGFQNKEIALQLNISERTVKFHVSAILRKLNAGNRTEAVTLAIQYKLVRQ